MVLNDRGEVDTSDYKRDVVQLSPTISRIRKETANLVPYLKSMIGTEILEWDGRYGNFSYLSGSEYTITDSSLKHYRSRGFDVRLLEELSLLIGKSYSQKVFESKILEVVGEAFYEDNKFDLIGYWKLRASFIRNISLEDNAIKKLILFIESPKHVVFKNDYLFELRTILGDEQFYNHLTLIKNHTEQIYHVKDSKGKLIGPDGIGFDSNYHQTPLPMKALIQNSYESILKNFVKVGIIKKMKFKPNFSLSNLNKIILSIPNTFTPLHRDYIREIILAKFPEFSSEYIKFISESDAVAMYYSYNHLNNVSTKGEHILVYDMGAGTLDITYFKLYKQADQTCIKMIGKLGKITAGNYLDYILAKEVYSQIEKQKTILKIFDFKATDVRNREAAISFKIFIKDIIKPHLGNLNNNEMRFTTKDENVKSLNLVEDITIDLQLIRDSNSVNQYLNENSRELFDRFKRIFKDRIIASAPSGVYFPIDKLILTGRGSLFYGLRDKLKSEFNLQDDNLVSIEPLQLKTIVVDGALAFAKIFDNKHTIFNITNHNLNSIYGLLYQIRGNWHFLELLKPGHISLSIEPKIVDGITISEYFNSEPLNIIPTSNCHFIQSYSNDPAYDMQNNNSEYITPLSPEISGLFHDSRRPGVGISVDGNDKMSLYVYADLRYNFNRPVINKINMDVSLSAYIERITHKLMDKSFFSKEEVKENLNRVLGSSVNDHDIEKILKYATVTANQEMKVIQSNITDLRKNKGFRESMWPYII